MDWQTKTGRVLFAIALAFFGVQHFIHAAGVAGPAPGPPWILGTPLWGIIAGAILVAASLAIATAQMLRPAAMILAVALLAYASVLYGPALAAHPRDPGRWTSASELVALAGAAWILGAGHPAGRFLYAAPLFVFGVLHFMHAAYLATLIPRWISAPFFWANFVGVAFVAAGAAIATRVQARLAAVLLGAMFLSFVVVLHAPRVLAALHDHKEWTSAFVALAMSGGAFVLAGGVRDRA